ncbi:RNA polymerase sigma factor SigJ [Nonomuraea sp. B19D2]|uniref:RNA polymerase sigma factor SigJ n=1 Tax=Nonomuraea sp. B19D2 TaxID=3159561 RepID=UPI0032DBF021
MNARESELAAAYEQVRPRLVRVAYAVLGSHAEAEDVVSECWLRLIVADGREPVVDVEAFATTTVARAALDTLRSARRRRELYLGPWLPEPIIELGPTEQDPADRVTLDDTISYALLVVLETLTPAERTAWVLHDLFGMRFTDVAQTVGRTPAAVRQLAARARAHINARAPRVTVGTIEHNVAVARFLQAAVGGDLAPLLEALDPDVILTSDGGGQVTAARRPVHGADNVARFLSGAIRMLKPSEHAKILNVNGTPGLGFFDGDSLTSVVSLTFLENRISRIDIIRAPSKLPRPSRHDESHDLRLTANPRSGTSREPAAKQRPARPSDPGRDQRGG